MEKLSPSEKRKQMPKDYHDFIVIGAGLAGICAAISGARLGLKVALVHNRPVLGGNASPELGVCPEGAMAMGYNRFADETGIADELRSSWYETNTGDSGTFGSILWEKVAAERNLCLYISTEAVSPVMKDKTCIRSIIVRHLRSGKERELFADTFADCSGDGHIAYSAGAEFRMGREARKEFNESLAPEKADGKVMCATLMFKSRALKFPVEYTPPKASYRFPDEESLPHRPHGNLTGAPWWLEFGGELDIVKNEEKIFNELHRILFGYWDHRKNRCRHKLPNRIICSIAPVIAKRESRRFTGDYILTENDIRNRTDFEDAVAYGGWPIDIHPPGGIFSPDEPSRQVFVEPYSIPYRCLYSRNIKNLFFAGRNISVTHVALGSTRVMWTCAVMGEAVGTAADLCKKFGRLARGIYKRHIRALQQQLLKQDCYIMGIKNRDRKDIARTASVRATSSMPLAVSGSNGKKELTQPLGQTLPVSEKELESLSLYVESTMDKKSRIMLKLYKTGPRELFSTGELIARSSVTAAAGHSGWVEFRLGAETQPGQCYWFSVTAQKGVFLHLVRREFIGVQRAIFDGREKCWKKDNGFHERHEALWRPNIATYCFKTEPRMYPYGPENVINGFARPEGWPNIWISDPRQPPHQQLMLRFPKKRRFSSIHLTFNVGLNRTWPRDESITSCVKSYQVFIWSKRRWRKIIEEGNNLCRHRVHGFEPASSDRIKLKILETHGSPSAELFEIRVY